MDLSVNLFRSVASNPVRTAALLLVATVAFVGHLKRRTKPKSKVRLRASSLGLTQMLCGTPDEKYNLDSIINVVVGFDDAHSPSIETIRRLFETKILLYERFHCVPMQVEPGADVVWIPKKVNLDNHILPRFVDENSGETFEQHVDDLINQPLQDKKNKPWWEVYFLESFSSKRLKMVMRFHHCLGDGVSLYQMMAEVLTDSSGKPIDLTEAFRPQHLDTAQKKSKIVDNIKWWLSLPHNVFTAVKYIIEGFGTIFGRYDTPTPFYDHRVRLQTLGKSKFMTIYLPTHTIEFVRSIKDSIEKKTGKKITINDLEFSFIAGAIRRYVAHLGVDVSKLSMRALQALAFPEPVCEATRYKTLLRVFFTLISNKMPMQSTNAFDRILEANKVWTEAKNSTKIPAFVFVQQIGRLQSWRTQADSVDKMLLHTSMLLSNVPGPQSELWMGGGRVSSLHMVYPYVNPVMGFVSHGGRIDACLCVEESRQNKEKMAGLMPKFFLEEMYEAAEMCGVAQKSHC